MKKQSRKNRKARRLKAQVALRYRNERILCGVIADPSYPPEVQAVQARTFQANVEAYAAQVEHFTGRAKFYAAEIREREAQVSIGAAWVQRGIDCVKKLGE